MTLDPDWMVQIAFKGHCSNVALREVHVMAHMNIVRGVPKTYQGFGICPDRNNIILCVSFEIFFRFVFFVILLKKLKLQRTLIFREIVHLFSNYFFFKEILSLTSLILLHFKHLLIYIYRCKFTNVKKIKYS